MKKVTILAATIALFGFTAVSANAQTNQQTQTQQTGQEGNREKVTQDQLPEAVQTALKNDVYKDWTVSEIYKVSPAAGDTQGKVVYEITMANAQGQKGTVLMNEDGGDASKEEE